MLKRNLMVLDFPNKRLQLTERRQMPQEEDDMSGLHLLREHGAVVVYCCRSGKSRSLSWYQAEDEILALDGKRSVDLEMQEIRDLLKQRDGKEVKAAFSRNGESYSTIVK